jgi:hypothetical protein
MVPMHAKKRKLTMNAPRANALVFFGAAGDLVCKGILPLLWAILCL